MKKMTRKSLQFRQKTSRAPEQNQEIHSGNSGEAICSVLP
jgi:hypothetical protein